MPKNPPGKPFGVMVAVLDDDRRPVYLPSGQKKKRWARMGPAVFTDGSPQDLYNKEGVFKGMTKILQERGLTDEAKLKAQCLKFKCEEGVTTCCQRRVLYNQPDFANQLSIIEELAKMRGHGLLFLPKFHCELNFIEQCWGAAKRVYREYPTSHSEDGLRSNVEAALDSVPLKFMRRSVT
jgi:hypothetical protein